MTPQSAADLVPHAGVMCLLDDVIGWQTDRIHCRSGLKLARDHPLSGRDGLPATALIEYAAQATAAHGTLIARAGTRDGSAPADGQLVALRGVDLAATTVDMTTVRSVDIHAERILADAGGSIYAFCVIAHEQTLVSGRLTVRNATPEKIRRPN